MNGADSEVGRLETVMLHRPGAELKRLTPRNNDKLLFDGIPWVGRAQEEHDAFAAGAARPRGRGPLPHRTARRTRWSTTRPGRRSSAAVLEDLRLGDTAARSSPGTTCTGLDPEDLAQTLIAGLARRGAEDRAAAWCTGLMDRHDFVIDPLPNLLFTRDSSVWIGDRVAVTSLAMPARARETQAHPR